MIKPSRLKELMDIAIRESEKSVAEDLNVHPKVGAVIVDEYGKIIVQAHRGEKGRGDHAEFIAINKAKEAGYADLSNATIFATLEPCMHRSHTKKTCAQRIVEAGIRSVYFGALDPNPSIIGRGEQYLRTRTGMTVERFPSELERRYRELNQDFWSLFAAEHLPTSSFYVATRVPDIIMQKLKAAKIEIDHMPDSDYTLNDLAAYVSGKGRFAGSRNRSKIWDFLFSARGEAFDQKYSNYTYDIDARSHEERWKKEFHGIMKKAFRIYDFESQRILNVGIGNGLEGVGLFDKCEHFLGVDIAPESLQYAQARLPKATLKCSAAENLDIIETGSQDIYVSLRTYQSAFFDIHASVSEAYRVLTPKGVVVISIANAYIDGERFIKGLLPRGSKQVDHDLAHNIIQTVRRQLNNFDFEDVGVITGKAEEYVFARKQR